MARRTFIDGTTLEDIEKEAREEVTNRVLGKTILKTLAIAVPIATAIGVGSHYLENAWISAEYLDKVPDVARIIIDVAVGYLSLRGVNKFLPYFFAKSIVKKEFEKDHPKGSIASQAYLKGLGKN